MATALYMVLDGPRCVCGRPAKYYLTRDGLYQYRYFCAADGCWSLHREIGDLTQWLVPLEEKMAATPLVPEVIKVPAESSLPSMYPAVEIDFALIREEIDGVSGKELAGMKEWGAARNQHLNNYDTQLKLGLPAYKKAWAESDIGALERVGDLVKKKRLSVEHEFEDLRAKLGRIREDFNEEHDRLARIEQFRIAAEQRAQDEANKQRVLAELEAERQQAMESGADDNTVAEIDAQREQVAQAPIVPIAVSKEQAIVSSGQARKAIGTTSTPIYIRTVTLTADGRGFSWDELAKWLTYLGSKEGRATLIQCGRVKHLMNGLKQSSDEITLACGAMKRDLETIFPGLTNHKGTESSNRGR